MNLQSIEREISYHAEQIDVMESAGFSEFANWHYEMAQMRERQLEFYSKYPTRRARRMARREGYRN